MIDFDDNIKKELLSVIDKFCGAIPTEIAELIKNQGYIAGGAIVNSVLSEPINDYDIFLKEANAAHEIKQYFTNTRRPFDIFKQYETRAITENGVTLKLKEKGEIIQIVTRFTGPPTRVFESFDFEHCMCYFDFLTHDLYYNKELIMGKTLIYSVEDNYPVNAMKRAFKFCNRGWTISPVELLSIMDRANEFDLTDVKVRANQLIGYYT